MSLHPAGGGTGSVFVKRFKRAGLLTYAAPVEQKETGQDAVELSAPLDETSSGPSFTGACG